MNSPRSWPLGVAGVVLVLALACGQTQRNPSGSTPHTPARSTTSESPRGTTSSASGGSGTSEESSDSEGSDGTSSTGAAGAAADACACFDDRHCSTLKCNDGSCAPPRCEDGIKNGGETDVDCGGAACRPCIPAVSCVAEDCAPGSLCVCGWCEPGPPDGAPSCRDGEHNGDETDVDCGGPSCPPCSEPWCCWAGDCESRVCHENRCQPALCNDAVMNGSESDVDCGGAECKPCPLDRNCTRDDDCDSGTCREVLARPDACGSVFACVPVDWMR